MRRELFAAASVLVLMTGGALAQSSTGTTTRSDTGTSSTMSSTTSSGQLASAEQMLGKSVVGQDGKEIGEVEDVILDPTSGQARQLVIGSGGFLGIGEKKIAIDFQQATWNQVDKEIKLSSLTREDVKNMKTFEYSDSMTSLNRPHKSGTMTTPSTTGPVTTPAPQ